MHITIDSLEHIPITVYKTRWVKERKNACSTVENMCIEQLTPLTTIQAISS